MTTYASDGTKTEPAAPTVIDAEPTTDEDTTSTAPDPDTAEPEVVQTLPAVIGDNEDYVVRVPDWVHTTPWEHNTWLEFKGDKLAIRVPTPSALNALSRLQSKYMTNKQRGEILELFLKLHLSPESNERVMFRQLHPQEPDYTIRTLGDLVNAVANTGVDRLNSEVVDVEAEPVDKP